ncbi:uncharacterized protein BXZ73DRAFT_54698, partial [Epithele typhae]|uniref:uncharacterized protein n=1 Tax=Epithele typhae TaxID=378194 RepID=UPI0020073FB6
RVTRQYRVLKWRMYGGVAYQDGPIQPGSLALRCPTCPFIGVNTPEKWTSESQRKNFPIGIVTDASFSAQHTRMKDSGNNVPLAEGHLITVADQPYKKHLVDASKNTIEVTCNDHKAAQNNHGSKSKSHLDVTGIGAAACSRHGIFLPHTCVDLQLGEAQRNMDYCLFWAFQAFPGVALFILIYDIVCQYHINMRKRFNQYSEIYLPETARFLWSIGQFHVHGHINKCFSRFSLNFVKHAGAQDGETMETLWPDAVNAIKDSTRGMTDSHRHEVLDDNMTDWNWKKLLKMPDTLIGKWKRAIIESKAANEAFERFNKGATEAERKDWQKEAEEAHRQRELNESSESMDIFNAEEALLPTLKETAHHMILAEGKASARGDVQAVSSPDASWLSEGILIEHRRKLGPNPSDKAKLNLAQKRQRLQSDLKDFNLKGFSRYNLEGYQILESLPGVSSLGEAWDDDEEEIAQDELLGQQEIPNHSNLTTISEEPWNPEKQPAAMPSTLGFPYMKKIQRVDLVQKEIKLRVAEMNDCITAIREGIVARTYLYQGRVKNPSSYRTRLRSQKDVQVASEALMRHVRFYTGARQSLFNLYDKEDEEDTKAHSARMDLYPELTSQDLKANPVLMEPSTSGLRNEHGSWIWSFSGGIEERASFVQSIKKSMWLRAYERKCRWEEELLWVPFEMACTVRSHKNKAEEWKSRAQLTRLDDEGLHGHQVYAYGQAATWEKLADNAHRDFVQKCPHYQL